MKRYLTAITNITAIALISVIAADVLSTPARIDGVIYYTLNTPSGSWQEMSAWCGLLFVSISLFFRKKTLPGRITEFFSAAFSIVITTVLITKFYFTIAFLVSGQDVLLIEPTESIFAYTWGRISSMTLMLIVSVLAIYEYFRKLSKTGH